MDMPALSDHLMSTPALLNHGGGKKSPSHSKKDKIVEEPAVKNARNRFKSIVKHIAQDSLMQDDDADVSHFRRYSQKKRDRLSVLDTPRPQASFVMKLFDRGVDLAQFDEGTPLYPICRAWMQNKPHNPQRKKGNHELGDSDSEPEMIEDAEEVHRLPPPLPLPVDECGALVRVRIPPPLESEAEPFDINYDDDHAPSPALLFQNHLDRWNLVRQRWREASALNDRRYDTSFAILRQIHERVTNPIGAGGQFSRMTGECTDNEMENTMPPTSSSVEHMETV